MELFFSSDMDGVRRSLQMVEWGLNVKKDGGEFLRIDGLEVPTSVKRTAGMSGTCRDLCDISAVQDYTVELNMIAGSYPRNDSRMM